MNWRLRNSQPDYHIQVRPGIGEVLVPLNPDNRQAEAPKEKVEPMPHPPSGPIKVGGKVLHSSGSYADIFPVLAQFIKPGKGDGWIIHAGACQGVETERLYTTYWRPTIAIEPDPRNLQTLRRRLMDLQQSHPFDLKVYPFAVGEANGRVVLHQSNNNDGTPWVESNTIQEVKLHTLQSPELNWKNSVEVGMIALDSMHENMGRPHIHLLFSDVEGAEKRMLQGAQKMLRNTKWVFTEWSKNERYSDAMDAQQTFKMLPGKWECMAVWDHGHFSDMLVLNRDI